MTSAAIVNKELVLPIDIEVSDIEKGGFLPYELKPVLEQLLQIGEVKINPYQAFNPVPAKVTISMNNNYWKEIKTNWKGSVTREFNTKETIEFLSGRSDKAELNRLFQKPIKRQIVGFE